MNNEYNYPDPSDSEIQSKLYRKREFYYHRANEQIEPKTYDEIKKYRDDICGKTMTYSDHQSLLQKFISPDTPYHGLLLFHNVGSGKTCAAIGIAENFKEQVIKYGTKIYILCQGPIIKEVWKNELINCTGTTYTREDNNRLALKEAFKYYKLMSFTSFYNKVLGQKIIDKENDNVKYKLTDEGEILRNISIDKIESLDNTLIIVDEAHNLTGNERGSALKKILDNSKNTKIILLSATPMKNFADDIIELINFIRPKNDQIQRDKVFTNDKNHLMKFKDDHSIEYLQKMCNGYVSYYKGTNPLTFAIQKDIGDISQNLLFTKVIKCEMSKYQYEVYKNAKLESEHDALEKKTLSVANFVFPNKLYGNDGIIKLINLLKYNKKDIFENLDINDKELTIDNFLYENNKKNLTGKIFNEKYLKHFSTKFYDCLQNIKNTKNTVFVYSNLVKTGVELFEEVLLQNGFLEYNKDNDYKISNDTICYKCHNRHINHTKENHQFSPSIFISVTGSNENNEETISNEKQKIIKDVFNNIENKEGKWIKVIIGSKVMNEGVTLENIGDLHILDVHYNLGRVFQVIGRGIRYCKHYKITNEENKFPEVRVYKYIIALKDELLVEEDLYRKAEIKYLLIKQVETILKGIAIDCPLNYNNNTFLDNIPDKKDCTKHKCTDVCNYIDCHYSCQDKKLNLDYYDKHRNIYKKINPKELDYGTFTLKLAKTEIDYAISKIKEMFKFKYIYLLDEIITYIKNSIQNNEKKELYDDFYIYKALDKLLPISENDFNNFTDIIYDKYNMKGYLIYRKKILYLPTI